MHFESVRAQLDDYKTRSESKTEETDHLRKDRKKVKKSHNKDREKADSDTELEPWNDEKRHGKDVSAQEGNDASELLTERKRRKKHRKNKPSTESEQKAGENEDPQTSGQTQKTKKSAFTKMCHFLG
ncbi:hypothetical protein D4764_16G0009190 [Takifugu flavidus]|uniref:Uncharacterized protein n=1 Tax=Takifugu flavidus TaxID=433684 RepID=A0A5C6NY38_9TELE|nr:hypothetical protein D4764_16G0009190 [Takifugu flavidus]